MREMWTVVTGTGGAAQGLAAKAVELNGGRNCRVVLVHPQAWDVWCQGVEGVYHIPLDGELIPNYQRAAETLAALARVHQPGALLFSADAFGRTAAPWVAAALETGITADCTAVTVDSEGCLIQRRPTYGGRRIAAIQTRTEPCIMTIRPGVCPLPQVLAHSIPVEEIQLDCDDPPLGLLKRTVNSASFRSLTEEEVILAGGLGLGSRENFQRLAAVAKRLGCGVGASRGAVAAGYAPYAAQVGQTGVTVRPRIYVAFGISGQAQHLSGMSGAGLIISINTDPRAPIFQVSDYALEADCTQVLRLMEQRLDHQKMNE